MERGGSRFAWGRGGRILVEEGDFMYGRRNTSANRSALGIFLEVERVVEEALDLGGDDDPLP